MISSGTTTTPFTDLPAHRIIRYFTRESSTKEEQVAAVSYSGLSRLWSERRRREEDRFAMLLADLVSIAKELDVVVSGARQNECYYDDADDYDYDYDYDHGCDYEEETHDDDDVLWLNDMKAKVQTLLQDAHHVLGTPTPLVAAASTMTTPESLFDFSNANNDNDNDDSGSGIGHGSLSLDVISLYMRDHSNSSSFTSEGPTLLEGDPVDSSGMLVRSSSSKLDAAEWLLGDGSPVSGNTPTTNAANTNASVHPLDQYREIDFVDKAVLGSRLDIANGVPSLFSATSITSIA